MAETPSSTRAVVAAIAGNGFVALIKFIAFALSGSGAMLSEGIHSVADTGNQVLLYLGVRRARRRRDEDFPYGYGGERFVFGLLSASGIFFIGGGVTIYHSIHGIVHPSMPEIGVLTFAVLGVSLLIEGAVLLVAIRTVFAARGDTPIFRHLTERTDPAMLAVLLEDSVAVIGVLFAAAGIGASAVTRNPIFDSIASMLIGLLLCIVAIVLVVENRELLLGKAVPDEVRQKFVEVLRSRPSVRDVHDVKTRQLTPETFLFKAEVAFHASFLAAKLEAALPPGASLEGERRSEVLCELAKLALTTIGSEIDQLEHAVRAEIPEARHIDLEVEHLHRGPQPAAPADPQASGPLPRGTSFS